MKVSEWTEYNVDFVCLNKDEAHTVDLTYRTDCQYAVSGFDHDTGEEFDPGDLASIQDSNRWHRIEAAGYDPWEVFSKMK